MKIFDSQRAVIFDLGDTLIEHTISLNNLEKKISKKVHKLLSNKGYSIPEKQYNQLKTKMWEEWKDQYGISETEFNIDEFLFHLLIKLGVNTQITKELLPLIIQIIYKYDLKYLTLKPTVKETLQSLKKMSFLMGIISNSSYSYDHILNILKHHGIIDYFNLVLVSSKENICKPSPKIFHKALQILNISPKDAVFIGNNPQIDHKGAKRAGIRSILIVISGEKTFDMDQNMTDVIKVQNLIEILKYLKK